MNEINRSAILPYSAEAMFDLINDIEAYPEFLDGCVGAQILLVERDKIEARLDLKKGIFRQQIITRNINSRGSAIDLELLEGPLKQFSGRWEFENLEHDRCKVSLVIKFSIGASIADIGLSKLLDSVTNSLVDSVIERARTVYG